jgi:hypothetical protein
LDNEIMIVPDIFVSCFCPSKMAPNPCAEVWSCKVNS